MGKILKLKATRPSMKKCMFLIGVLSCIYLIDSLSILDLNSNEIYIYIIKPIIWCSLILIIWIFPRIKAHAKLKLRKKIIWCAICLGILYAIFTFLGGFIDGFGESPYDLSPLGIIKNIIIAGSMLMARESVRAYVVNSLKKRHFIVIISLFTIFMTIINLPLNRLYSLKTGIDIIQYLSEYFLPELSKNIFASYLVYIGGPIASIGYLGIIEICFWLCPVLPDLKWITKGLVGILCPIFSLILLQYMYDKKLHTQNTKTAKEESPFGLIITSIIAIAIVWFVLGVFPIHPDAIATGSMKPIINPGDVVLIKKMNGNEVNKHDIIQFKMNNVYVFHRIIDIKKDNNQTKYITKGDNNSVKDSQLVNPEDVKGKVIYIIPKIGWPTILFKNANKVPKGKFEF